MAAETIFMLQKCYFSWIRSPQGVAMFVHSLAMKRKKKQVWLTTEYTPLSDKPVFFIMSLTQNGSIHCPFFQDFQTSTNFFFLNNKKLDHKSTEKLLSVFLILFFFSRKVPWRGFAWSPLSKDWIPLKRFLKAWIRTVSSSVPDIRKHTETFFVVSPSFGRWGGQNFVSKHVEPDTFLLWMLLFHVKFSPDVILCGLLGIKAVSYTHLTLPTRRTV